MPVDSSGPLKNGLYALMDALCLASPDGPVEFDFENRTYNHADVVRMLRGFSAREATVICERRDGSTESYRGVVGRRLCATGLTYYLSMPKNDICTAWDFESNVSDPESHDFRKITVYPKGLDAGIGHAARPRALREFS